MFAFFPLLDASIVCRIFFIARDQTRFEHGQTKKTKNNVDQTHGVLVFCFCGFQGHDHLPGRQPLRGKFQGRRYARQGELIDGQSIKGSQLRCLLRARCQPLRKWRRRSSAHDLKIVFSLLLRWKHDSRSSLYRSTALPAS